MRVGLTQPHRVSPSAETAPPRPLLAPDGAHITLGGDARGDGLTEPLRPAADTLFGPRGVALAVPRGPLFVSDTGHHRVLAWRETPGQDRIPADFVLGQPDFASEGRNARHDVGRDTMSMPVGIAVGAETLAVADAWNHRVLLWHGLPRASRQLPDIVLGQADFTGGLANRGAARPAPDTLNWCYGVAIRGRRLIVADAGNRRVLAWDGIPERNGAPAGLVLGQEDFSSRDDGGGGPVGATGMRWPHAAAMTGDGSLLIADAGTSRIMVWRRFPTQNGAPCDAVLGQADFTGVDRNRGSERPSAATLNTPYGLAIAGDRLLVADTGNSRLLGFNTAAIETGMPADRLSGQIGFDESGENRWLRPQHDSLCWPYGITSSGDIAVIADTGNNRVLVWKTS